MMLHYVLELLIKFNRGFGTKELAITESICIVIGVQVSSCDSTTFMGGLVNWSLRCCLAGCHLGPTINNLICGLTRQETFIECAYVALSPEHLLYI